MNRDILFAKINQQTTMPRMKEQGKHSGLVKLLVGKKTPKHQTKTVPDEEFNLLQSKLNEN